jgi:hypothetical protein
MATYYSDTKTCIQTLTDNGCEITYLTGADLQPWIDAQAPVTEAWIAAADAAGYPGQDVYDAVAAIYDSKK